MGINSRHYTIEPDLWREAKQILFIALHRTPPERTAYLEQACKGDEDLRSFVDRLLQAEECACFLDYPVFRILESRDDGLSLGDRIGTYRLERLLGKGGMGTVYLATREDDFTKFVALKVLKRGMDTEEIVRRFRRERQILADLNHPNIAQLFDGGTTIDGLPYLVMEFIDGEALDYYCRRKDFNVENRLQLFQTVCHAVHFAHQNLVAHRDLKPSNILVTAQGVPKLLDFGIAKLIGSKVRLTTTLTDSHRLMTPGFASPEQWRGDPVGLASDVYTLGVILYLLLANRMPYPTTAAAVQAHLGSGREPDRPSQAVRRQAESGGGDADRGRTRRLQRTLRGDLDSIVLRALQHQPGDRYASAEAFADDIERYLSGKAVLAREGSRRYILGRFLYRHRLATLFSSVGLIILFVLSIAGWLQAQHLERALVSAQEARNRAEMLHIRAEKTLEAMEEILYLADPDTTSPGAFTRRTLLDQGSRYVSKSFYSQPEILAELLERIGQGYRKLGLYPEACDHLERALEIQRKLKGDFDQGTVTKMANLSSALKDNGQAAEAEHLLVRALMIQRQIGAGDLEIAVTLNNLASLYSTRKEYAIALHLYRESLAIKRRHFPDASAEVARSMNNLAATLARLGDHAEAVSNYERVLEIRRQLYGRPHSEIATTANNLAASLKALGRLEEAESFFREALEMRQALFGPEHPKVATSLLNLAATLQDRGCLPEAIILNRKALEILSARYEEGHPNIITARLNLGSALTELRRFTEAENVLRVAIANLRDADLANRWLLAVALRHLALLHLLQEKPEIAESEVREALAVARTTLAVDSWRIADLQSILGGCLAAQHGFEEAKDLLLESHAKLVELRGPLDRSTRKALDRINAYRSR